MVLPKDSSSRVIGSTARGIVHYRVPAEQWEYHEITGSDHGIDCIIELIEDGQYGNKKIECQIKGTRNVKNLQNGDISFPMDVKTINYGLGSSIPFLLFLVSINDERVYYLPVQEYFIGNKCLFDQLEKNEKTMNLHIPTKNYIGSEDENLKEIARYVYYGGPSESLKRICD